MPTPGHLVSHINNPALSSDNTLHLVTMITNPIRYHSRYRLYREFEREILKTPNVVLYTVEVAYGDRQFEVTSADNPRHLQLRSPQATWFKESAINLGMKYLVPRSAKYLGWIDADISHQRQDWAQEAIHQLQTHPLIQTWQNAIDLGPDGEVLKVSDSFCWVTRSGGIDLKNAKEYRYGHTGFSWACTRLWWENVGGLPDFCVMGAADHHAGWASLNLVEKSIPDGVSAGYRRRLLDWQARSFGVTQGHLGFVQGAITHGYHGAKKNRAYVNRWQYVFRNRYDPDRHLRYDEQGLIKIVNNAGLLRDTWSYFLSRKEDATEV